MAQAKIKRILFTEKGSLTKTHFKKGFLKHSLQASMF